MEQGYNGVRYFIVDHGGILVGKDGDLNAKRNKNEKFPALVATWMAMAGRLPSNHAEEDRLFIANEQNKIQAALDGRSKLPGGVRFKLAACLKMFLDGVEKVTRRLRRRAIGEVGCEGGEERDAWIRQRIGVVDSLQQEEKVEEETATHGEVVEPGMSTSEDESIEEITGQDQLEYEGIVTRWDAYGTFERRKEDGLVANVPPWRISRGNEEKEEDEKEEEEGEGEEEGGEDEGGPGSWVTGTWNVDGRVGKCYPWREEVEMEEVEKPSEEDGQEHDQVADDIERDDELQSEDEWELSPEDRLDYDGWTSCREWSAWKNRARWKESRRDEEGGSRCGNDSRIIAYRRYVIPERTDVPYTHRYTPAVYLAALQFLSTLRCVAWGVYEALMERHRSLAWFQVDTKMHDTDRRFWKHRLRHTKSMSSMAHFRKHGRDTIVCELLIRRANTTSMPEWSTLPSLIRWLPTESRLADVIRLVHRDFFSEGGMPGYLIRRIQPMERFLYDLKYWEGSHVEGQIEDEIIRGVQEQYLADLCAVWQEAYDARRLEPMYRQESYGPARGYNWSSSWWYGKSSSAYGEGRRRKVRAWRW